LRHPLNRGSKALALRDYFLWNAVRFSMDARHAVTLPGGAEIILGRKENYGSAVYTHFLADYREMLIKDFREIPDLFFDIQMLIEEPPRIACRLRFECAPKGVFMGLRVDGKRVVFCENVFYEFREGKIDNVWSVIDKAAIEAQL